MNTFKITTVLIFAALFTAHPAGASEPDTRLEIIVLIENGGTVEDPEAASVTIRHLFDQLSALRRKRAAKHAQISIVLTASPTQITWSGTPAQLLEQAQDVLKRIEFKSTPSDLVLAWEQIDTTLQLAVPSEYRLYWIGPAIHVPFSAAGGEVEIKVPQAVPADMKFADLAEQASVLRMYGVHPDQDTVYLEFLRDHGLIDRARKGALKLSVMGAAQTLSHLNRLL